MDNTSTPPEQTHKYQAHKDASALELRREHFLREVIAQKLDEKKRRSYGPAAAGFYCHTDLVAIWDDQSIQAVFFHFSDNQKEAVKRGLLYFISFLVVVDVEVSWIATCATCLFKGPGSTSLAFSDHDKPRSRNELISLGLSLNRAKRWEEQHQFRPATIEFETKRWEPQEVDSESPLPFEIPDDIGPIHGGFGDSSGGEGIGTVRASETQE